MRTQTGTEHAQEDSGLEESAVCVRLPAFSPGGEEFVFLSPPSLCLTIVTARSLMRASGEDIPTMNNGLLARSQNKELCASLCA